MTVSRRIVLAGLHGRRRPVSTGRDGPGAPARPPPRPRRERVQFVTSAGKFTLEVYPEAAPKTVANFMQYVKAASTPARSSTA